MFRARRHEMNLSLEALARQLNGSPGQTFLSRVERGTIGVTPALATRLAHALRLPEHDVLLAAGFAPEPEIVEALKRLQNHLGTPTPREASLAVYDAMGRPWGFRKRLTWVNPSEAFLIDLTDIRNEPFIGEALVLRGRSPEVGQGVIAETVEGLRAFTFRGDWIEDGGGRKLHGDYEIIGVIGRVASEHQYLDIAI
jgi:transcriptional regulator with XRE-family HTH domain